jgi:hypothetical protein
MTLNLTSNLTRYPLLILPPLARNASFEPLIYSPLHGSLIGIRKRRIVRVGAGLTARNVFISAI